jgi:DHA1 family multidrug resistance protein-like MFS transporter
MIMSISFQASAPFLPLFLINLGVHPLAQVDLWSGVIQSSNFIFSAVFSPFWGRMADRTGRKTMVIRSCAAVCVATALMGLSPNVWFLFIVRALMGIFSGFSAAGLALVGTQVPEESLGFALGWMATGQLVGAMIGPLIGGLLADWLGYRATFFWTSAGAFAAAMTCALLVHEGFQRAATTGIKEPLTTQFRALLRHPRLVPLFVVVLLAQLAAVGIRPIVPLFVRDLVGSGALLATFAGMAFAVTGVADLIASPFLGKRSDRIGYRKVLLISLIGIAVFTVPQGWSSNIWVFLGLRFMVGAFLGGVLPTANAWIGRSVEAHRRGEIFGISASATFFGMFIGPLIAGGVASRFGFVPVFVVFGALAALNALWIAVAVPSEKTAVLSP